MSDFPTAAAALRDRCDTLLATLDAALTTRQAAYAGAFIGTGENRRRRQRFWQGLTNPPTIPADGAAIAPDLAVRPTDQAWSWADANLSLPATLEVAVQVDVYEAPSGHGFVLVGLVRIAGRTFRRAINHGPETWRGHDWQRLAVGGV